MFIAFLSDLFCLICALHVQFYLYKGSVKVQLGKYI